MGDSVCEEPVQRALPKEALIGGLSLFPSPLSPSFAMPVTDTQRDAQSYESGQPFREDRRHNVSKEGSTISTMLQESQERLKSCWWTRSLLALPYSTYLYYVLTNSMSREVI